MAITITIDDTPEVREALDSGLEDAQVMVGDKAPATYEGLLTHMLQNEIRMLSDTVFVKKAGRLMEAARRDSDVRSELVRILERVDSEAAAVAQALAASSS